MKPYKNIFPSQNHFTACMARATLLETSDETEKFPLAGALILNALTRWSRDLQQDTQPTGEVLPGPSGGPGRTVSCGVSSRNHKMQIGQVNNLVFAPGFFEGKPRSKNKNKTPQRS